MVLDTICRLIRKEIGKILLPPGLQNWLKKIVNTIAAPYGCLSGQSGTPDSSATTAEYLQAAQDLVPFARWSPIDDATGSWFLKKPADCDGDATGPGFSILWDFIKFQVTHGATSAV